jgi:hypothetical protein
MNWLERARREITESARRRTASTAEGHPTAVMAVRDSLVPGEPARSIGGNGSALIGVMPKSQVLDEAFEERAAIVEFEGGATRQDAERIAGAVVWTQPRR